jgi:hypothetical protein
VPSFEHPCELTSDERRRELACIFANGVIRLRRRCALAERSTTTPRELVQNSPTAVKFRAQPCSVSTRVNSFESPDTRSTKC